MNTNNDELERLLGDELNDRAGDIGGARLNLSDVRGRARSIRRTRVAVSTMGAAAVIAAVVVPMVLVVGPGRDSDTLPPAESPTVNRTDDPADPDDSAEPVDPHPPLAYALGSEIHPVDGAPFTPQVDATEGMFFARFGDQWVVGTYNDTGFLLSVVDGTGKLVRSFDAAEGSGVVSNEAGTAVTWLGRDGSARVLAVGEDEPAVLPGDVPGKLRMTTLTGLRGDDCSAGDCELLFQVWVDDHSENYRMTMDGQPERILPELVDVTDISPDGTLATGATSVDVFNQTSCSAVVEMATGDQLWETCKAGDLRFSPDGEHVLGNDPYLDGPNHWTWMVFDAGDGSQVRRGEGIVYGEDWDSPTTWLVVLGDSDTDRTRVVRYELGSQQPTVVAESDTDQLDGPGFNYESR